MAWTQTIDREANCVIVVHEGTPENGATLRHLNLLIEHPDYPGGMNILRDLRAMRLSTEVGYNWLLQNRREFRDIDRRLGPCRYAMIFGNATDFGFGNQVRQFFEDSSVERRPFTDMREAKLWLGLPEDYRIDLLPND
jgi:hypothetical protein